MAKAWQYTALTLALFALAGCVVRTLTIRSEPQGADVWLDGQYLGKTPVKLRYNHYGSRLLLLRKEGYHARVCLLKIAPPWYQVFPLDIFTDLLLPFVIEDSRSVNLKLSAQGEEPPEGLLQRAEEAR